MIIICEKGNVCLLLKKEIKRIDKPVYASSYLTRKVTCIFYYCEKRGKYLSSENKIQLCDEKVTNILGDFF